METVNLIQNLKYKILLQPDGCKVFYKNVKKSRNPLFISMSKYGFADCLKWILAQNIAPENKRTLESYLVENETVETNYPKSAPYTQPKRELTPFDNKLRICHRDNMPEKLYLSCRHLGLSLYFSDHEYDFRGRTKFRADEKWTEPIYPEAASLLFFTKSMAEYIQHNTARKPNHNELKRNNNEN